MLRQREKGDFRYCIWVYRNGMDPLGLNLRHLRAFADVAAVGSVSHAARRVHLSQPAITQAIAKLERQLGARLFDRRPGGMAPTSAGARFALRTSRALAFLEAAVDEVEGRASGTNKAGFTHFAALMTMAQIRALIAVTRAGNFSLAARETGISQPSLHRSARDLEKITGLELFQRAAFGVRPTRPARILARAAQLALSELSQGLDEIHNDDAGGGLIRVGSMPLAKAHVLPRALNRLLIDRPDVRVRVVEGPYDDLLHALRHGEVDLLIGALRDPAPVDDVVEEELFSDPLAVVARHGHPLTTAPEITIEALARYPWVVPIPGAPSRAAFERLFDPPPTRLIETGSVIMIRELLTGSNHLTLMSAHQMRREEEARILTRLPFDLEGTVRKIGLTIRRGWIPTRTQSAFLDHLREVSAELPRPAPAGRY